MGSLSLVPAVACTEMQNKNRVVLEVKNWCFDPYGHCGRSPTNRCDPVTTEWSADAAKSRS